jgi:hypothetical protein
MTFCGKLAYRTFRASRGIELYRKNQVQDTALFQTNGAHPGMISRHLHRMIRFAGTNHLSMETIGSAMDFCSVFRTPVNPLYQCDQSI